MDDLRRIVTSHNDAGTAVVHSDERIGLPALPGVDAHGAVVWTTGAVPADNVADLEGGGRDPGATIREGSVFRVTEFGPGFVSPMHRTHSIDYCCLISGELELVLDGGEVIRLAPGDTVVQRGTNHVWRNPSDSTSARIVVCMIEAEPVAIDGVRLEQHF